uniref:Odorant receptor n=1 Tax=Cacopsylla melanoneura TaxID=428564 RepID=A0A8D8T1X2_9HEMI
MKSSTDNRKTRVFSTMTNQAIPLGTVPKSRLITTLKDPPQPISDVPTEINVINEYPCFYYNIKLYELGNLFSIEQKEGTQWSRIIIPKISWGFIVFMSLSFTINVAKLLWKNYTAEKQVVGTEIFQRSFEVLLGPLLIVEMMTFVHKLYPMIKQMRATFDTSEERILQQCIRHEKSMFFISIISANLVICLGYLPKIFLSLSYEEITSAKYYYNKAHPEKQLPLVFWLPFDDTVPPTYYFMVVVNIYALVLTIMLAFGLISNISTFSIHMRGQYQMLALKLKRAACWSDLKYIIQKHQKLEEFRRKLEAQVGSICLLKTFIYNLTITLLMYEFTAVKQVNQESIQVVFEWVVLLIMFYSFTTSSEYIDEGNDILCNALRSYKWYNINHNWYNENYNWYNTHILSKDGVKALQLFTMMCNKPKRLIYYGGTVDISNNLFLAVIKLSYTLFTILKHSIHTKQ